MRDLPVKSISSLRVRGALQNSSILCSLVLFSLSTVIFHGYFKIVVPNTENWFRKSIYYKFLHHYNDTGISIFSSFQLFQMPANRGVLVSTHLI